MTLRDQPLVRDRFPSTDARNLQAALDDAQARLKATADQVQGLEQLSIYEAPERAA